LDFFLAAGCRDPDPQVPVGLGTGAGLSLPVGGGFTTELALLEPLFTLGLTGGWDLGRGGSGGVLFSGEVGLDSLVTGLAGGGAPLKLIFDSLAEGVGSGWL